MRAWWSRIAAAMLLSLALMPTVHAEGVMVDRLDVPARSTAETTPFALSASVTDIHSLTAATLHAPRASVCIYETAHIEVVLPAYAISAQSRPLREDCKEATRVVVSLVPDGEHRGRLTMAAATGSRLSLDMEEDASLAARALGMIGNSTGTPDEPRSPWSSVLVDEPHVVLVGPGAWELVGGGMLKVTGPDVYIETDGTRARVDTGEAPRNGAVAQERVTRWVNVVFEEGRFMVTASNVSAAFADGCFVLGGPLRSGGLSFAEGETVEIAAVTTDSGVVARLRADAAPERTTLASLVLAAPAGLGLLFPAAALAVAGGVLAWTRRRPRKYPAPTGNDDWLEWCVESAAYAEATDQPIMAVQCLRAARREDPTNAFLAAWEADCHRRRGDHEAALACLEEAAALDPLDAMPLVEAAALAASLGDVDSARAYYWRATARSDDDVRAALADTDSRFDALRALAHGAGGLSDGAGSRR